jgi:hypothetical protein
MHIVALRRVMTGFLVLAEVALASGHEELATAYVERAADILVRVSRARSRLRHRACADPPDLPVE